jgi:hypothetical protein
VLTEIVIPAKQGKGGFALLLKQSETTAHPKQNGLRIERKLQSAIRNLNFTIELQWQKVQHPGDGETNADEIAEDFQPVLDAFLSRVMFGG